MEVLQAAAARPEPALRRALLTVACGPPAAAYGAALAILAVLLGLAPGADLTMSGTARTAAVMWLAAHHVALVIRGGPLGVLPLLFTVSLVALVVRTAARAAARAGLDQPRDAGWIVASAAGGHAVSGAVLTVVMSAAGAPGISVSSIEAAIGCALLAGAAATGGMARRCGLLSPVLARVPGWAPHAVVGGLLGLALLLAAGLGAVLLGLLGSASEVGDLFGTWATGAGSALGLTVLCLAYLPNAAIGAASWLSGPGLSLGTVSVSPFTVTAGPLPAVPLLAAVPQGPAGAWSLLAFAFPVLAGVAIGYRVGQAGLSLGDRVRAATAGTGVLALGCLVAAGLADGRLGAGVFDPVDVPAGQFALAVIGWALGPAVLAAWWYGRGAEPGVPDTAADGEQAEDSGSSDGAGEQAEPGSDDDEAEPTDQDASEFSSPVSSV